MGKAFTLSNQEIPGCSKYFYEFRTELVQMAAQQAHQLGANAITGIKFESVNFNEQIIDTVLTGTAVAFTR